LVLGELAVGHGMYGTETLLVRPRRPLDDVPAQLRGALQEIVSVARDHALTLGPGRDVSRTPAAALLAAA
jgi:hypothetical protein